MKKIKLLYVLLYSFIAVQKLYASDDRPVIAIPVETSLDYNVENKQVVTRDALLHRMASTPNAFSITLSQRPNNIFKREFKVDRYLTPGQCTTYFCESVFQPNQLDANGQLNQQFKEGIISIQDLVNSKANLKDGPICINSDELPAIVKIIEDEAHAKGFQAGAQQGTLGGIIMGTCLGAGIVGSCWLASTYLGKKK